MTRRRTVLAGCVGPLLGLAGCAGRGSESTPTAESTATPTGDLPPGPYRYTHPQKTGNRVVSGATNLRDAEPVRFAVDGRPTWLVAHPAPRGSYWTVVTAEGVVTRRRVADGTVTDRTRPGERVPGRPPVVAGDESDPELLDDPSIAGPNAGQTVVSAGGEPRRLFVAANGDLVVDGGDRHRLPVDAPPDVRPAVLGDGRCVVYGDVTGRYGHGALGDTLEPSSLVVVDPAEPEIVTRTVLDAPLVFEGLQPLVADLDGDGDPEVVTTVADAENGARVAVHSPAGERVATGPVHGPGWRHQLAVAPFGPDGATELAVVLKPHVTRRLEYYRLEDGDLSVRATVDGVSSHAYGSRVLDGAVAVEYDDGTAELLVPTADRRRLAAVTRDAGDARIQWEWELGGRLTSNLAGLSLDSGGVAVGCATAEEVLVWSG